MGAHGGHTAAVGTYPIELLGVVQDRELHAQRRASSFVSAFARRASVSFSR
jgi:hypothetical protein